MAETGLDLHEEAANELYASVGFRITRLRRNRGLRQQDLATAVRLTRSSIANAESGRQRLPLHVYFAIAEALGVEPADILVTGRDLPSLADRLPVGAFGELSDVRDAIGRLRASLDKAASLIDPLLASVGDAS